MELVVLHFVELQLCVRLLSTTSCRNSVHVLLALHAGAADGDEQRHSYEED